ncbi:MAG TPA: GFA family protein [Polyangiaceae bacterium]|nr:GFA family protein [Polyangiaceae bacterium]
MAHSQDQQDPNLKTYIGGCHCGAVRFEAELDPNQGTKCNCSICTKKAFYGVVVKPSRFRLLSGETSLADYQFNTKMMHHQFCTRCGIHTFGRGHLEQLGGDYISVNLNCLDDLDLSQVKVMYWDGRHNNWAAGPSEAPYSPGGR